jgi:hypothetical protein
LIECRATDWAFIIDLDVVSSRESSSLFSLQDISFVKLTLGLFKYPSEPDEALVLAAATTIVKRT